MRCAFTTTCSGPGRRSAGFRSRASIGSAHVSRRSIDKYSLWCLAECKPGIGVSIRASSCFVPPAWLTILWPTPNGSGAPVAFSYAFFITRVLMMSGRVCSTTSKSVGIQTLASVVESVTYRSGSMMFWNCGMGKSCRWHARSSRRVWRRACNAAGTRAELCRTSSCGMTRTMSAGAGCGLHAGKAYFSTGRPCQPPFKIGPSFLKQ
mmetsp:Transcript_7875/g.18568  ORF Transcript_7875/g.18568 Transcript_7875/m.18568 type:complete len:207 (-) Transcript_7875:608-1228(-)